MLDILQSYLIRKTRCLIASYDTVNTLSRNARCCRQMNAEVAQMTRPSRVKPQQRLVVPTHSRTQKRKKTESLLLSMMKQPQISHLFQKLDERPTPPPRPTAQPDSQAAMACSQFLSPTFKFNFLSVCVCVCAARTQQVTLSLSQTVVLCEVCRNAAPPKSWQLPQKQWGNVWMSEARPNHLLHRREREQENKTAAKWAWSSFYQQVPWFSLLTLRIAVVLARFYLYFEAHALNCRSEKKTWNYLPQTGSTPDFSTLSRALNPDSNLLQIKRKALCTAATAAGDGCVKMGVSSLYKSRLYQILPWCLLVSWKASDALDGTSQSSFLYQLHLLSLEIILWCSHHELGFFVSIGPHALAQ